MYFFSLCHHVYGIYLWLLDGVWSLVKQCLPITYHSLISQNLILHRRGWLNSFVEALRQWTVLVLGDNWSNGALKSSCVTSASFDNSGKLGYSMVFPSFHEMAGSAEMILFSSVAVTKKLRGAVAWKFLLAMRDWSPTPWGCELSSFYELSRCGSGQNTQGRPVGKTQGLEGNAVGDSKGRALPFVDVGVEPHRHVLP